MITGEGFTEEALASARSATGVAHVEFQGAPRMPHGVGVENVEDSREGQLLVELQAHARGAPVVSALVGAGARIEEVRRDRASLEEVFLSLMEDTTR